MVASCQTTLGNSPNFQETESYSFEVDDKIFRIEIPSDGKVGEFNVYLVETPKIKEDFLRLFAVGYDLLATKTKYYSLSNFSFGLTKGGCCGVDHLLAYEKSHREAGKTVTALEVDDTTMVRVEITGREKKNFAKYYVPYDDDFTFYFVVLIYEEAAGNSEFVKARFEVLDEIVASFVKLNKRLLIYQ